MLDGLRWSWCNKKNKCTINITYLNHPETIAHLPSQWKNCLLGNQSLVPKRLGTAGLEKKRWEITRQGEKSSWIWRFVKLTKVLLLLSRFSRVWLYATPETAGHQAPPYLGFSRKEHWSGLPFPSPMHESEKWKWSRSVVSDSKQPHRLQPTRLLRPWDSPGKSTGVGCHCC